MTNIDPLKARTRANMNLLANASELISRVVHDIAGNDIASTLNQSPVTLSALRLMVQNRIRSQLQLNETR